MRASLRFVVCQAAPLLLSPLLTGQQFEAMREQNLAAPPPSSCAEGLATADIDGDGDTDLVYLVAGRSSCATTAQGT